MASIIYGDAPLTYFKVIASICSHGDLSELSKVKIGKVTAEWMTMPIHLPFSAHTSTLGADKILFQCQLHPFLVRIFNLRTLIRQCLCCNASTDSVHCNERIAILSYSYLTFGMTNIDGHICKDINLNVTNLIVSWTNGHSANGGQDH